MNRPFAIYPGLFDSATLGYWRFGESGGRLTPVGGGPTFTNHGAESVEDGYRFVRDDGDWMEADYAAQPVRSALTFECWVRDFQQEPVTNWSYRQVFQHQLDEDNMIGVDAIRRVPDPTCRSRIMTRLYVGGVCVGQCLW